MNRKEIAAKHTLIVYKYFVRPLDIINKTLIIVFVIIHLLVPIWNFIQPNYRMGWGITYWLLGVIGIASLYVFILNLFFTSLLNINRKNYEHYSKSDN